MLLAVDTSTTQVGLALYDGVQIIGETLWHGKMRHTTSLAPAIAELFKRTNATMDDLAALGVALGPGSFTSLRVGLALVKGLALARHLPLIGIPTLDSLAAAQPLRDIPLAVVLQAGRGRLALGWYHASDTGAWQSDGEISVLNLDELIKTIESPTMICGELSEEERSILAKKDDLIELSSPVQSTRRPAFLAELAWKRWQAGDTDEAASLAPIYLQVGASIPA